MVIFYILSLKAFYFETICAIIRYEQGNIFFKTIESDKEIRMNAKRFNELVNKMKTDSDAFVELYDYFFPRIVLYSRNHLHTNDGDDIAHSFFTALLTRKSDNEILFPCAFVYTSCRNIYLSMKKKKYDLIELNEAICGTTENKYIDEMITAGALMKQCLTERESQIIYLYRYEGLPLKEIAVKYGLHYGTIRQIYRRAMLKLDEFLKKNQKYNF